MFLAKLSSMRALAFSTLSAAEAQGRTKIVKKGSVLYNSHLVLNKGTTYRGLTNISF